MAFLNSLDVLIGLIVIYLTLALACTVINEWIDATLHVRGVNYAIVLPKCFQPPLMNPFGMIFMDIHTLKGWYAIRVSSESSNEKTNQRIYHPLRFDEFWWMS